MKNRVTMQTAESLHGVYRNKYCRNSNVSTEFYGSFKWVVSFARFFIKVVKYDGKVIT